MQRDNDDIKFTALLEVYRASNAYKKILELIKTNPQKLTLEQKILYAQLSGDKNIDVVKLISEITQSNNQKTQQLKQGDFLQSLPKELRLYIAEFLKPKDIINLGMTKKDYKNEMDSFLINSELVENIIFDLPFEKAWSFIKYYRTTRAFKDLLAKGICNFSHAELIRYVLTTDDLTTLYDHLPQLRNTIEECNAKLIAMENNLDLLNHSTEYRSKRDLLSKIITSLKTSLAGIQVSLIQSCLDEIQKQTENISDGDRQIKAAEKLSLALLSKENILSLVQLYTPKENVEVETNEILSQFIKDYNKILETSPSFVILVKAGFCVTKQIAIQLLQDTGKNVFTNFAGLEFNGLTFSGNYAYINFEKTHLNRMGLIGAILNQSILQARMFLCALFPLHLGGNPPYSKEDLRKDLNNLLNFIDKWPKLQKMEYSKLVATNCISFWKKGIENTSPGARMIRIEKILYMISQMKDHPFFSDFNNENKSLFSRVSWMSNNYQKLHTAREIFELYEQELQYALKNQKKAQP